jgi:ABC-type branched-subunit amino acid transport system ATPase component
MCKLYILLFDKPSASLIPILIKHWFKILTVLRKELYLTFFFVEQNVEAALRFTNIKIILAQDEIIPEGNTRDLLNNIVIIRFYTGRDAIKPC